MPPPPPALLDSLVEGPSRIAGVEWHDEIGSTNAAAAAAAARGAPEIHLVLADRQTAGRGRRGRVWQAPAGTSLLASLLVRPAVPATAWGTLPLLAGLALAETVGPHVEGHEAALKWPNDLLVDGRKAAGVLVEGGDGWAVVGVGLNVDWRGVDRPAELAGSTSMAEAVGRDVDRWRVLAGFIGVFSRRYDAWQDLPGAFLDGYRSRCATLGSRVRVTRDGAAPVEGTAETVAPGGALAVRTDPGALVEVSAGDVEHLRPA